jgi:hypothetical protein
MVDCASRLFDLSLPDFLTHFDTVFPQAFPWIGCNPRSEMISVAISTLCKRRSEPESFPRAQPKPPIRGSFGWHSVENTTSTRGSPPIPTHSHSSKCLTKDIERDDSRHATSPCELAQWLTPYEWWDKHIDNWGPGISDLTNSPDNSTSAYNDN